MAFKGPEDRGSGERQGDTRADERAAVIALLKAIASSEEGASISLGNGGTLSPNADQIAGAKRMYEMLAAGTGALTEDELKQLEPYMGTLKNKPAPKQAADAPPAGAAEGAASAGEQSDAARLLAYQQQKDAQAAAASTAKKEEEKANASFPFKAGAVVAVGAGLGFVLQPWLMVASASLAPHAFLGGVVGTVLGSAMTGIILFVPAFYLALFLINPKGPLGSLARMLGFGKKGNGKGNNGPTRKPGLQPKTPNPKNGLKADGEEPEADADNGQKLKGQEHTADKELDDITGTEPKNGEDEPNAAPTAGQSSQSPFSVFNKSIDKFITFGTPAFGDSGAHLSAEEAEKVYQARAASVYNKMDGLVDEHGKYVETTAVARGKTLVKIQVGNSVLSPEHVEERLKGIAINASIEADKARESVAEAIERFKQMSEDKEGLTDDQNAARREYHHYVCSAVLSAQKPSFDAGRYENMIGIAEPSADQRLYLEALKKRIGGDKLDGAMPPRPEVAESLGKPAVPVGTELNAGGRRGGFRYADGGARTSVAVGGLDYVNTGGAGFGLPKINPTGM